MNSFVGFFLVKFNFIAKKKLFEAFIKGHQEPQIYTCVGFYLQSDSCRGGVGQ